MSVPAVEACTHACTATSLALRRFKSRRSSCGRPTRLFRFLLFSYGQLSHELPFRAGAAHGRRGFASAIGGGKGE